MTRLLAPLARWSRQRRPGPIEPAFSVEHAYRFVFDNSMDAALLTTPDGRIVMANRASSEMFGYSADELRRIGREAVVDVTDPQVLAAIDERRRTGRFRGEITMRRKDGSRFPVEVSSAIFRDEQGHEWTSMFARDISDRKAQEAERERLLRELDAKRLWLEAVLEHVPLSVLLFEPDGRLSFNRKAEEALGMTLSATAGSAQYASRILHPDGKPVSRDELVSARVLGQGETVTGAEYVIERPDGSRVPILGAAGPIRDGEGRVIGAIGILQDVSERMRAEEAVRTSEQLLNGIFELLPVGVWIADSTGRIVRGNPAGIRIWAGARYVGPSEFGEYRAWWADTGKKIEPEDWALARALNKGETSIGEVLRIQCFDDTYKTIINSALPLYDEQGRPTGAIVVNEDITRLKETEAALRQAVESRQEVLEIVAHDLRHPLQVIVSVIQALLLSGDRPPEEHDALHDVDAQVQRMDRLIQDLLDVAQLESSPLLLQRSHVRPEAMVAAVCEEHDRLASASSIVVRSDVRPGLPEVDVDAEKIKRVFDNLIANALKFTPPGGSITVGAAPEGRCVRCWVADTGTGIDAASLPHIFTRRWQADATRRGLGLGLAIAKAIVDAHGGRISATSEVGRGTTVSFTLPSAVG